MTRKPHARVRTETETSYATSVLMSRIAPSVTRPSLLINSTGRCVGRVTRRSSSKRLHRKQDNVPHATSHETKLVYQFGTLTDCKLCYSKQYYRKKNQTPSAAQKEKVKKANGGKRKTRKSVKKRQADVPSEEDDDSEQEPMSIRRKRKVTKTGGKRE